MVVHQCGDGVTLNRESCHNFQTPIKGIRRVARQAITSDEITGQIDDSEGHISRRLDRMAGQHKVNIRICGP